MNSETATCPTRDVTCINRVLQGDEEGCVIDIRTPVECQSEHIAGCSFIPLDQLASRVDEIKNLPGPYHLLCRTGSRAKQAQTLLQDAGISDSIVVEGGLVAYKDNGGQTVMGQQSMSLERQVRIAAGFLVALGVGLSFVHTGFLAISGFVGVGLMFSGITDTCGMAMILAKMPWNKVSSPSCSTSS